MEQRVYICHSLLGIASETHGVCGIQCQISFDIVKKHRMIVYLIGVIQS